MAMYIVESLHVELDAQKFSDVRRGDGDGSLGGVSATGAIGSGQQLLHLRMAGRFALTGKICFRDFVVEDIERKWRLE
jgi:hypothetical protein